MADNVRVEIGFAGGGATTANIDETACKKLLKAVEKGEAEMVALDTEGGALHVNASLVAWMRVHARESRVGF